jgi:beta-lactamase regulating signal transducer with metallopeptidase domain
MEISYIQNLLAEPPFQALGWALIHFLWQGALVALALAGCKLLLRGSTARVRYAVSCLFLLVLLALPVLTFVSSMAEDPSDSTGASWVQAGAAALLPASGTSAPVTLSPSVAESVTPFLPWVVGIWMAGVMLLTVRWVAALAYLRRLRRTVSLLVPPEWERALQHVKGRIAVSASIRLSISRLAQAPSVIGWLRPVILMPAAAMAGLEPSALEAVFAHELAHIRRHDYLVNLLQSVVDTLLFYHPAVWWVSKQIRIERENCCDDLAAEACGDRVIYARALVDLEQSRVGQASFAPAANGGSLLHRIQRLLRSTETDDRRGPSWFSAIAGLAVVALVLAGFYSTARATAEQPMDSLVNVEESPAVPQKPAAGVAQADASQAQPAPRATTAPGPPHPSPAPEAQPEIASTAVGEGDESPTPTAAPVGQASTATSATDSSRATTPQAAQPAVAPSSRSGGSSDFLSGMQAAGFRNLTIDQLIDLKTHGVTPEFARGVQQAGYADVKPEQLIKLRDHGVDARFMQGMKSNGLDNLSLDELVKLRDHGLTPDYIAEMKTAGYGGLSEKQLLEARDHGVNGEYLRGLKAGGIDNLSLDEAVRLRDHGVDAKYITEMKDAGYGGLNEKQLVEARDHGVDGEYLRGLKAGGIDNLSLDEAVHLRDHGLDAKYITEMKDAGYGGLKADALTQLRDHGVDGAYVRGMKAAGFADLPTRDLVRLRDHGVTPEFISEIKAAGYGGLPAEQYEKLRDQGVDGAYIRKLNQNGLHNLTVEQLIRMRQAGI